MIQISVIIPSYKPGDYLFKCLDSVISQTLSIDKYEVLLVLNGPRDPYYDAIDEYIRKYVNVRILYEEKGSVSNARNVGMKMAVGTYFCFIDDDDIISPNYLEELLKISTCSIVGVSNVHSFTNSIEDYGNDFFACKVIQRRKYPHSLFWNRAILSFPVAKLIHRSIISNKMFDLRFTNGEDALFMTLISDNIKGFSFTDKSVCYYVRERKGSATRKYIERRKILKDSLRLICSYISIYLTAPLKYNFLLFLARIPGVIKGGIMLSKNSK